MANQPVDPGTGDERGVAPDGGATTGTPRWVKVLGVIALALILLVVVLQFVGGGGHGPGRHGGGSTPPAGVTEDGGHTPPPALDHGGQQP